MTPAVTGDRPQIVKGSRVRVVHGNEILVGTVERVVGDSPASYLVLRDAPRVVRGNARKAFWAPEHRVTAIDEPPRDSARFEAQR